MLLLLLRLLLVMLMVLVVVIVVVIGAGSIQLYSLFPVLFVNSANRRDIDSIDLRRTHAQIYVIPLISTITSLCSISKVHSNLHNYSFSRRM